MGRQQASKIYKTKRKSRDVDQILNDDLKSEAAIHALEHQKFDEYLPGLGQHYCIPCAKYFESEVALTGHTRSKIHKRQLKNIKFGPYTPEEAAAGAGHNVEKYLLKQQQQNALLENAANKLTAERSDRHIKRRQKSGKMDIEEDSIEQPIEAAEEQSATEEISV